MKTILVCFFVFASFVGVTGADPTTDGEKTPLIHDNDRVVFIGDSNTYAGGFIAYLDASIRAASDDPKTPKNVELINLGLSSETSSGLSEPDHPFPRPCVHERLDRVLEKTKPDLVVACYGMNDAIYHPFDEGRFETFKKSIEELIAEVKASGSRIIIVTPPPFDAASVDEKKLRPDGSNQFAWFAPYEKYDDVIAKYAEWERTLTSVDAVVDLHGILTIYIERFRKADPKYVFAGDGVHFGDAAHKVVAEVMYNELKLSKSAETIEAQTTKLLKERHQILRNAWLSHVGHKRPGIKKGLPLEEANSKADKLLEEAYRE